MSTPNLKVVVYINTNSIPSDCFDINVHVKNVAMGIITNDTETMIKGVYDRISNAFPEFGTPSTITWEYSTECKVCFNVRWF